MFGYDAHVVNNGINILSKTFTGTFGRNRGEGFGFLYKMRDKNKPRFDAHI